MRVLKYDNEKQIVYGEIYAPGVPDAHGDFMTEDTIIDMAHNFLANNRVEKIDVNHDHNQISAVVVESFIARKNDPDFIEGSWVTGVKVNDQDTWNKIKKGELNGFSLDGKALGSMKEIEIEIPESVEGRTTKSEEDNHEHTFTVKFDEEGNFMGGGTDEVNGHSHKITKGTVTESVEGHNHRFSFVEVLTNG
ncbi:MAG: hypothetical protein GQ570_03835 [Helicobacteraceae bacterium]|nr:hypothetical protein [Helicobacteraceae bacterium]